MKKLAAIAALSCSAVALSAGASRADYTLNILHINDWHSRIESNNKFESTCSAEEEGKGECIGGAARLITAIAAERKKLEGQNVLLLDAGDNFQGSLFYSTFKGTAELEFLNQMKFDAMTVGNHEFDDGEDPLADFLGKATFPVLGANVVATPQSKLAGRVKPSVVLEIGGQKIGIIGVVTTDTAEIASPGPNISFGDDRKALADEVEKLKSQGVNKIIAMTHVGYARDRDLLAKVPGVDVIVGGHSHTLLSNTDAKAEGPYPTMIDNPDGYKVPVTQAASYSKYLGEFRVVFDDNGVVKEASGDPIYLDNSISPDAAALARIKELGAPIEELKSKEVAETTAAIDGSRETCRAVECQMGNLIADAILDRTKDQGVSIVIQNGGGIRASIDQGIVTMGEVLTVLPFQNTIATFQLSGADLRASLEGGLSEIEEGKGKFPQVAGMRYSFDKSVAPNAGRLKSAEVMDGGNWVPLDDAKTYTVATNNFVRQGGDGYKLFATNAKNAYDYGPGLEQVVADYLGAHRPYTPKLEGRITEVAATTAEPAKPAETTPPAVTTPELPAGSNDIATTPPKLDDADMKKAEDEAAAKKAADEAAAQKAADEAAAQKAADEAAAQKAADEAAAQKAADEAAAKKAADEAAAQKAADQAAAQKAADEAAAQKAADEAAAKKAADEAAAQKAAEEAAKPKDYVVAKGDSLWKIAQKFYGDGHKYSLLEEANPEYKGNKVLPVGATIKVPPAA